MTAALSSWSGTKDLHSDIENYQRHLSITMVRNVFHAGCSLRELREVSRKHGKMPNKTVSLCPVFQWHEIRQGSNKLDVQSSIFSER
jgi:hypothetical protein